MANAELKHQARYSAEFRYNVKLAALVLLISIIYSLLMFDGIVDFFAPKTIVQVEEVVKNSTLSTDNKITDQIPGFYAFGAIVKLTTNISSFGLLSYPIQMIPHLILFYTFIYRLSNSYFLASSIAVLQLSAGTTGTSKLFIWPHGMGSIIFYTVLLLFVSMMLNNKSDLKYERESKYIFLFILAGVSNIFMSYNLHAITIIFLFIFIILTYCIKENILHIKNLNKYYKRNIVLLSAILVITQLGLSNFIYQTFLPTLKTELEITTFEKLFISYFQKEPLSDQSIISDLLITYTPTITMISLVKYITLLTAIAVYLCHLINKYRLSREISFFDLLTFSLILTYLFYGIVRLNLGDLPINAIYMPGILCIVRLYTDNIQKFMSYIYLITLLVLTPAYTLSINDVAPNQNINYIDYIGQSSDWYFCHKDVNIASTSDEFTRNFYQLYIQQNSNTLYIIPIIEIEQIASLLQNTRIQKTYYIINYKSSAMSIQNWQIIKSWTYSKNKINNNDKINKIYNNEYLMIYL